MLFEKFSVGKAFCWELSDQRGTKNRTMVRTFVPKCLLGLADWFLLPNKHFGTKVRTMVRFFVPLWSQSSQRKAFPTEKQKVIKYISLNDFCVSSRHRARLGSNLSAVWRIFFFAFSKFKYYFFIIFEYFLILPKNLEMPSTGTPKIPRFKIIFSMCECCPFFIFCLFLAFQRKVRILTTQKSLTTIHLVNFYKWFQSTTLSDHLSFFSLLGMEKLKTHLNFWNLNEKLFVFLIHFPWYKSAILILIS